VLDQNVKEEVKDIGFVAMEEVTFEQIMDEVDSKTQGAQENAESPYDTESEIKIIKSYQAATISGSLFMPDDDLASISGFKTQDSADHVSEEGTDTLHAFADKSSQLDPLGHLHAEPGIFNTKIDELESSISKNVGIKRLHNDLEVTAAKLLLLVYVSTARIKLVLLVKIEENILSSYYCLYTVNAASIKVTTAQRLRLLKKFLLSEKG
ncbi:hypothetical protein Tco_0043213, partial [Tanacetum coccineum]